MWICPMTPSAGQLCPSRKRFFFFFFVSFFLPSICGRHLGYVVQNGVDSEKLCTVLGDLFDTMLTPSTLFYKSPVYWSL